MKTAEEKAQELIDGFKGTIGEIYSNPFSEELELNLVAGIKILLKEQDRDTRHACAEAVISLGEVCETPTGGSAICPDQAHNACMNVKAV